MTPGLKFLGLLAVFAVAGAGAFVAARSLGGGEPAPAPVAPPAPGPVAPGVPAPATPPEGGGDDTAPPPAPPAPAAAPGDADLAGVGDPDDSAAKPLPADLSAPVKIVFADISQWDLDPRNIEVPASVKRYEGRLVDIVGYMIPYGSPEQVEEFVLVNDLGSCCFGQAPLPHHLIECRFPAGKSCVYIQGPVRVRGKFRVEEKRQGKYLVSVFAMTVTEVAEVR